MSRRPALVSIALLAAATIGGRANAASTGDGTDAIRAALAAQAWGRAESLAVAALAHARTSEDSADLIARVLVARWRNDRERTPGTLALAERALAIRLRAPGRDSIALAIACEGHAYGLAGSGRAREADEPAYRALGIRQRAAARAGGPASDVDRVRLRHLLGVLASHRRDYAEARARFDAEVAEREALAPRDTVEIARARMSLASAQSMTNEQAAAVVNYERALALFDAVPGRADRDHLYALSALVHSLAATDRYAEAADLAHRAVAFAESTLGPEHPQTGYAHRSLGYAYSVLGDFASAREETAHAVAILARAYGDTVDQVAQTRRMLAVAASKSGDFETALPIAREVLTTLEQGRDVNPAAVVDAMNSVAYALGGLGRRSEAMAMYERALALCDAKLGASHVKTTFQMANLAGACLDSGLVNRAESLLVIARARAAARDGPQHSGQVQYLRGLAIVYATRREWSRAESLLTAALGIARASSAGNPQDVGPTLLDRARVLADAGSPDRAVTDALEAASLHLAHHQLLADGLSEREALRFAAADPSGLPVAVSIAATLSLSPENRRAVWDAVVRARARVVDDMAERLHLAATASESESLATAFRRSSADLTAALLRGAPAARADSLRRRREALEVALGRASARWRSDREQARRGLDDVRAAMPAGTALVSYVRHAGGHASDAVGRMRPVAAYTAFVLAPGHDDPQVIALGDAAAIDSLVGEWNALAGCPPSVDPRTARRQEALMRRAGARLRKRVWDPVRAQIGEPSLALLVPDGALSLVAFATLPAEQGWLVEHAPTLHTLTAERDVVTESDARAGVGLLAFGAPDFDARGAEVAVAGFRGPAPSCDRFATLHFPPLPGSAAEMEAVVEQWRHSRLAVEPAQAVSGADASETRFKREAGGHRVLHLATHGFWLDTNCFDSATGRGVSGLAEWSPPASAATRLPRPAAASDAHPLRLGGLVLTGANHRDESAAGDDGVLTSEEIAALDLRGTEFAVLSSCRGGVGETQDGQGVSGLRRAFREAGVRTIVASVWPVGTTTLVRGWTRSIAGASPPRPPPPKPCGRRRWIACGCSASDTSRRHRSPGARSSRAATGAESGRCRGATRLPCRRCRSRVRPRAAARPDQTSRSPNH